LLLKVNPYNLFITVGAMCKSGHSSQITKSTKISRQKTKLQFLVTIYLTTIYASESLFLAFLGTYPIQAEMGWCRERKAKCIIF